MSLSRIGSRKGISDWSDEQDPGAKRFQGLCHLCEANTWVLSLCVC